MVSSTVNGKNHGAAPKAHGMYRSFATNVQDTC